MQNSFAKSWYAIIHVDEIPKLKPLSIKRLNHDLVVWKTNNNDIVIMDDKCPHRSAKLSLGKICNNKIICPFHGFEFTHSGICDFAPEFNKPINGLMVKTYPYKIIGDFVWVDLFNLGTTKFPKFEILSNLHNEFNGKYSYITDIWNSHITRCIENQLDYTHLPVVHHNTIGRNFKMPQDPKFIRDELSITIYQKDNEQQKISTEYIFSNAWILHISNQLKLLVYFVPIDEKHTLIYVIAYRKFMTNKFIKPIADIIMNISNKIILHQDKKVVISQGLQPSYLMTDELLMKHDTAIRYFRELWQNNL